MLDKLNNIYVGLVVNNQDPKKRGRVQVFIPNITNTLYKNWNEKNTDIKYRTLDSNVFNSELTQRLIDVLPWSEVTMPFFGGGTGAPVNTQTNEPTPIPTYGSQSPDELGVISPDTVPKQATSKDINTIDNNPWSAGFISAVATSADPNFPANAGHAGYVDSIKSGKVSGWVSLNPSTTTPQVGDIIVKSRDGGSHGDVVVGNNSNGSVSVVGGNVSGGTVKQFNQSIDSSYYSIIRSTNPNVASTMAQTAKAEANLWTSNGWNEKSPGAFNRLASYYNAGKTLPKLIGSPYTSPTTAAQTSSMPTQNGINNTGAIVGANAPTGNSKLASDRQSKFSEELKNPEIRKQLAYLASREVDNAGKGSEDVKAGSNDVYQQQFIETVVNRAMFTNRSISTVISDMRYWIPQSKLPTEPDYRIRTDYKNFSSTGAFDVALNKVLQGGNITNLATDNASVGLAQDRKNSGYSGVDINGEFYYRGNGGTAATKYANANGIEADPSPANKQAQKLNMICSSFNKDNVGSGMSSIGSAGGPIGMFSIPQVGAKAYVMFLDGNPLQPIVLGCFQDPSNVG